MILIIDNYDSFVFNLARYVNELGQNCMVVRNDKITLQEIKRDINPSHIILSPGPCSPNEAGICLDLVKEFQSSIPILGVCLGHQVIGQACGGEISRALMPTHGKARYIEHDSSGLFQGIPNPLKVGRYHSLIVSKNKFPKNLHINALSAEGEIMAVQHKEYPLYGVQFHPESVLSNSGHAILNAFINQTQSS